jgi:FixJ family two-component response regulator
MAGSAKQFVVAVDDDFRVRESIESLVESAGYAPLMFSSAEEFLQSGTLSARGA